MAGLGDMARIFAAGGGEGGMAGDAGSPDMAAQDPNAPEEGPMMGTGDPGEQLNQGISMIESALEMLPADVAEKARTHLEALKELSAQSQASAGPTAEDQGPMADVGQMESAAEPKVGGSAESYGT